MEMLPSRPPWDAKYFLSPALTYTPRRRRPVRLQKLLQDGTEPLGKVWAPQTSLKPRHERLAHVNACIAHTGCTAPSSNDQQTLDAYKQYGPVNRFHQGSLQRDSTTSEIFIRLWNFNRIYTSVKHTFLTYDPCTALTQFTRMDHGGAEKRQIRSRKDCFVTYFAIKMSFDLFKFDSEKGRMAKDGFNIVTFSCTNKI